jgi:hypothetical protein
MGDATGSDSAVDRERLQLERDRLKFERQKLAVDARLKRRELAAQRSKPFKELFANPVALAIAGGFVTLMTTIVTTSYTANENRRSEDRRAKQALQAELIKKFVDAPRPEIVRENLKFLVNVGFLPDYANEITAYLKENPDAAPTTATASLGDIGQRFEPLAPQLLRQLMSDFGVTDFQAAAIVGNIAFETAGFRILQELKPVSGRGSFGYLGWVGQKRASFEKFCQDKGLDPGSVEANYGFLKQELEGAESRAIVALKAAASLEDATRAFEQQAIRAGVKNYNSRTQWAQKALELFQRAQSNASK